MQVCPKCNCEIADSVDFCPVCGSILTTQKSVEKKVVKVRVRKSENAPTTDEFPDNTPALVKDSESKPESETSAPLTPNAKRILTIFGVVILGLLIVLLASNSGKDTTTQRSTSTVSTTTTTSTTVTTTTPTTAAPPISDTEYYYEKVCSMDIYDLQARTSSLTGTIGHYYKNLPIQSEDEEWLDTSWNKDKSLNQGAIYRSMAGVLEGFSYGFNSGSAYSSLLCGTQIDSRDQFEPYATNASTFISKEDSSNKLLKKLESLSCVHGSFDYANNHYHFVIDDLSKCAEEMMITEEMLGYCFGIFAEYAADITFDGNSCTIDRQL